MQALKIKRIRKMLKAIKKDLMTMSRLVFGTYEAKPLKKDSSEIQFINYLIDNVSEVNLFGTRYNFEDFIFNDYKTDEITEIDAGNSYNWNGPVVFQYRFFEYHGRVYTAICFHRFGDVRGNYTKYAILDCDQDEFWELLSEFYYDIPAGGNWCVSQYVYDESGRVHAWNTETQEDFEGFYESDEAPKAVRTAVAAWLGY